MAINKHILFYNTKIAKNPHISINQMIINHVFTETNMR